MSDPRKDPPRRPDRRVLLGFATKVRKADGRLGLRFDWTRILVTCSVLFVVGWVSVASLLFVRFRYQQGFTEVAWADMFLFPFRREANRVRFGDFNVAEAKRLLEAGKPREALLNLRVGVLRSPANLEGRILLTQFYLLQVPGLNRRDLALQTLEDGLDHAVAKPDLDYIRFYVQLLLRFQEDAKVRALAARLLPEPPQLTPLNRLLAQAAAEASFHRGNFDAAEDLVSRFELEQTVAGVLLSGRIAWDRGQREAALRRVEASLERFPTEDALFAEASRFARELGDAQKAVRYAILRTLNNPLSPVPRVEVIYSYRALGEVDKEREETRRMIAQFGSDENAMRALANYAADTGNIDLARDIYLLALEREFDNSLFSLLFIEANVVAGKYAEAIAFAEELARENPTWLGSSEAAFDSLRAVAYYGVRDNDLAVLYLNRFLASSNVRVETLLAVSRRFRLLGGTELARDVLQAAVRQDIHNQAALAGLISLDLELGFGRDLAANLRQLLRMRRPPTELLERAYTSLGSDRFLFVRDRESILSDLAGVLRLGGEGSLTRAPVPAPRG